MDRYMWLLLYFVFHFCLNLLRADVLIAVQNFHMCEGQIYPARADINFTKNGVYDIVDFDANSSVTLDNTYMAEYTIERSPDGEKYRKVLTTKSKLCTSLKMNFGDFIYKPMTAAGVPGRCPIPPGHYSLHNFTVDFRTFPLHFPAGYMKLLVKITDKDNVEVHCSVTITEIKYV